MHRITKAKQEWQQKNRQRRLLDILVRQVREDRVDIELAWRVLGPRTRTMMIILQDVGTDSAVGFIQPAEKIYVYTEDGRPRMKFESELNSEERRKLVSGFKELVGEMSIAKEYRESPDFLVMLLKFRKEGGCPNVHISNWDTNIDFNSATGLLKVWIHGEMAGTTAEAIDDLLRQIGEFAENTVRFDSRWDGEQQPPLCVGPQADELLLLEELRGAGEALAAPIHRLETKLQTSCERFGTPITDEEHDRIIVSVVQGMFDDVKFMRAVAESYVEGLTPDKALEFIYGDEGRPTEEDDGEA